MTTIALSTIILSSRSGVAQLLGLEADFQVVAEFRFRLGEALTGLPGAAARSVFVISRCRISDLGCSVSC